MIVLGDESGYSIGLAQQTKLATMEAMWETEPAPAPFNPVAGINQAEEKNNWAVQIPYAMGLIGTRSLDTPILGIHDIKEINRERIVNGMGAVMLMEELRADPDNEVIKSDFEKVKDDLGFGLLLKKYTADVSQATPEMIDKAVNDTIPAVAPMFGRSASWLAGFLMLFLFAASLFYTVKGNIRSQKVATSLGTVYVADAVGRN